MSNGEPTVAECARPAIKSCYGFFLFFFFGAKELQFRSVCGMAEERPQRERRAGGRPAHRLLLLFSGFNRPPPRGKEEEGKGGLQQKQGTKASAAMPAAALITGRQRGSLRNTGGNGVGWENGI